MDRVYVWGEINECVERGFYKRKKGTEKWRRV